MRQSASRRRAAKAERLAHSKMLRVFAALSHRGEISPIEFVL
jgi:hypothetical protein